MIGRPLAQAEVDNCTVEGNYEIRTVGDWVRRALGFEAEVLEARNVMQALLKLAEGNAISVECEWGSAAAAGDMQKDPAHPNWDAEIQNARAWLAKTEQPE